MVSSQWWTSIPSTTTQYVLITVAGILLFVAQQGKKRPLFLLTNVNQILVWLAIGSCAGILWAASVGQRYLHWQQLGGEIQQDVTIEGRIADISHSRRSDRLVLDHLRIDGEPWPSSLTCLIYYYEPTKQFRVAQKVRLQARVRPARAVANPAGFDTQKWYVSQSIVRTGYVQGEQIQLMEPSLSPRSRLQQKLLSLEVPGKKWLNALMFGDRSGFNEDDWRLLKQSGTAHLFAISGLHLAVAGGVIVVVVQIVTLLLFSMTSVRRGSLLPIQWVCMLAGSTAYAYCANWQVSVIRAYVVLCLFICLCWWSKRIGRWLMLMLTATLCMVVEPTAIYGIALYLSLGAVAVIMAVHWRWQSRFTSDKPKWQQFLTMQLMLNAGLVPLTLVVFHSVSWVSAIVNLIYVPLISVLIVPACVVGLLLLACLPENSVFIYEYLNVLGELISRSIDGLQHLITWIMLHADSVLIDTSQKGLIFLCTLALLVFVLPFRAKKKLITCYVIGGVLFSLSFILPQNNWEIHYFDVGQGNASLVTRNGKAVIFDTGAAYGDTGGYAQQVLLPFLLYQGLSPELVIISHFDNDHAGGLDAIMQAYPNIRVVSPKAGCVGGSQWQWEGLTFELLWPNVMNDEVYSENNLSCVVKVSGNQFSALFPGDIEALAEEQLTATGAVDDTVSLRADVLLAPHHGSATSSTPGFIEAVSPDLVVFSQGWLNRWGFPNKHVVNRYQQRKIHTINTSRSGYLKLTFNKTITTEEYRLSGPWYHKSF
ncbi:DNA internalization-related competence protein ComEC/Rec2 [Aestuariibacter sp. GS-14]|uniref:DNA internalization-related competence protein ComEC/Rec2 n=1 Tax=Aestuariibacter sp. GS-14 TaxID=2590670 RepID=UPI001127C61C|nr:DNA internalization-related competence protein ComEC/Rec2 [Aestuariibacter sp. GS-14]TPV61048.1 DNA internalization-related competence protein ComEC/Rec2 [Aestuariibacter sp. GS-14]